MTMNTMSALGLVLLLSFAVVGQSQSKKAASGAQSERVIRDLEHTYAQAVREQRVSNLKDLLADDFVATSSRGQLRNKAQEIDDIRPNPDYAMEDFKLDQLDVHVFAEAAVVTGRSTLKASYKGRSSVSIFRYTRVYAKRRGRWQVVLQQLTLVPQQG